MNNFENSPTFLIRSIFVLLILGIATLMWGKKTPGKGSWLVGSGILVLLTGIGFDSGLFLKEPFQVKIWKSGWIWPRDEVGAITVGVLQDPLSLAICALAALVAGTFLLNRDIISREPHAERTHGALAISTAGVAIAWSSLTPWLVFAGLILTLVGGFISLASRWEKNSEAVFAARFVWERSSGFLLAFFGTCVLATTRSALFLNQLNGWAPETANLVSTWIGSSFLVAGLFIQMQPFPLLGWLVLPSEVSVPLKILLNQIFPAWAAFPLLLRLQPQLLKLGLFPGFGWVALTSAVLIVFSGLFQTHWRTGISTWLAAGFSLACSVMAFSGRLQGMGLFLGVSLGALSLSASASALEDKCRVNSTTVHRSYWVKIAAILAVAAGTGVIGFVSATSGIHWIESAMSLPGLAALFLFVFFSFVLLGWKLGWQVMRQQKASETRWLSIFSLYFWVILSLGIVWTGTVSGRALFGDSDRLLFSLFDEFFGASSGSFSNGTDFVSASGLYWGALVLAFLTAYWTAGRGENRWNVLKLKVPRAAQFFANGYGIDALMKPLMRGLIGAGVFTETLIDRKIWGDWLPRGLNFGVGKVSRGLNRFNFKISTLLEWTLSRLVEGPAKALQFVQTGDVRWYLFFALGSGFALLSHFLKV